MVRKQIFLCIIIVTLVTACGSAKTPEVKSAVKSSTAFKNVPVVHAKHSQLVNEFGKRIKHLRGIAFGNQVWMNPSTPPTTHHDASDYKKIAKLGFNSVRFYLNYGIFENDSAPYVYKESGFEWIDKNIQWARDAGIYLILNIHVPQGGFQSNGEGGALWSDSENQKRFVALWQQLADRYKDEPVILGYDLLNEPVPPSISSWQELAHTTIKAIRNVDPAHLIIVERANAVQGEWNENLNGNWNFFKVDDPNIMYEFHFYKPFSYTHQGAHWVDGLKNIRGSYPDKNIIEANGTWAGATFDNPQLNDEKSGWTKLNGKPYIHKRSTGYSYTVAALQAQALGSSGSAYFDDITIQVKNRSGKLTKSYKLDMETGSIQNYSFWSKDKSGSGEIKQGAGRNDSGGVHIKGSLGDSNISFGNNKLILKEGYSYTINGWCKVESIEPSSFAKLRLDFYKSKGKVRIRNKAYLQAEIEAITAFARDQNAPVYLGEFGLMIHCFEKKRGGLQWVKDMITISESMGIHHNYHTYHEEAFGLYQTPGHEPPGKINQPLANLFKRLFW